MLRLSAASVDPNLVSQIPESAVPTLAAADTSDVVTEEDIRALGLQTNQPQQEGERRVKTLVEKHEGRIGEIPAQIAVDNENRQRRLTSRSASRQRRHDKAIDDAFDVRNTAFGSRQQDFGSQPVLSLANAAVDTGTASPTSP